MGCIGHVVVEKIAASKFCLTPLLLSSWIKPFRLSPSSSHKFFAQQKNLPLISNKIVAVEFSFDSNVKKKLRSQLNSPTVTMKLNIASLLSLFVIPSVWATGGVDQGKCTGCQVFEGKIDYKVIGNSMSYSEDRTNCYKKSSSSAHLSVPSGAKIEKAYLYWSGSGGLDNSVKLNGQTVYAQQTFVDTMHIWNDPNGKFYGAYADVTHKVSGSGTYKVTGLTFSNAYAYCQSNAAYGAWVLSVVYSDSSLADDTRIHVCQDNFEFTFPEGTYSESIDCVKPSGNCAREAELTLATFESDDYKGEHFYIQGKYKGDNLFNGQTAPNLDIAEFAIPEGDITGSTHSVSYTFNTYLVYSEFGWAIEGLYAAVAILKYTGEDCGVCPAPKVYDDCGSACPPTCTDPNPSCGGGCVKDCFCPDGLVLDEETDECVLYTDCKHNGGGGGKINRAGCVHLYGF